MKANQKKKRFGEEESVGKLIENDRFYINGNDRHRK